MQATTRTNGIALEEKFLQRAKGVLQNRAIALQEALPPKGGAEVIAEVARIGRHAAQLVLEIQAAGMPLVRSYDRAVPVLGKSSALAREISVRKGLGGDIHPMRINSIQKFN